MSVEKTLLVLFALVTFLKASVDAGGAHVVDRELVDALRKSQNGASVMNTISGQKMAFFLKKQ
jgi:hypothetical protein